MRCFKKITNIRTLDISPGIKKIIDLILFRWYASLKGDKYVILKVDHLLGLFMFVKTIKVIVFSLQDFLRNVIRMMICLKN